MSRKSDIDMAEDVFWWNSTHDTQEDLRPALAAAYDLGRAAQCKYDWDLFRSTMLSLQAQSPHAYYLALVGVADRLRDRVRKMVEGK